MNMGENNLIASYAKKIWNDAVWSKVISAVIFAGVLAVVSAIKSTLSEELSFFDALIFILTIDIKLWWLMVFIVIVLSVAFAVRSSKRANKQKHNTIIDELLNEGNNIQFKYCKGGFGLSLYEVDNAQAYETWKAKAVQFSKRIDNDTYLDIKQLADGDKSSIYEYTHKKISAKLRALKA
ncbi:MAG: hypothetical protein LBO69_01370 [Ignavibacteria bacterium]|jgi:hypothetical protein|nr:hypothetical protein [Ignavibacteria bacterium]